MNLNDLSFDRVGIFYIALIVAGFTGSSLGYLAGSLVSDPTVAAALINFIMMPLILFSGFFKQRDSLPNWVRWI